LAIQWGGWHGHLRVGIDVWTDGYDTWTPSINVYAAVYVQCDGSFNFADNQLVTLRGNASADYNFYNGLQANQSQHLGTGVVGGQGQNYGGGPNYYFEARLSGAYNGASPSVGVNFWLPARPPRVPAPPGVPFYRDVTATTAFPDFGGSPDDGGRGIDAYDYHLATDPNFNNVIRVTRHPATATDLAPGTTYWGRSFAHNAVGWSGPSGASAFTTTNFQTSVPTISGLGADAATLNWAAPWGGNPVSYEFQVATDSNFANVVQGAYNPSWGTSRVLPGLLPGTRYWARLRSGTSSGWGAWSGAVEFTTLAFATDAPTVTDIGPDTATVKWVAPAGATPVGYHLQLATNSAMTAGLQNFESSSWATLRQLLGLAPASKYWVRVRSKTASGYGSWSSVTAFESLSGAKIRRGNTWVDAPVFVRSGGRWVVAKVNKRVNGAWVL